MNEGLQYLLSKSLKNMARQTLKRPLKAIAIIGMSAYFMILPFILREGLADLGLTTPFGFVILATVTKLYIVMPATLSYFKRNGVLFKKPDVNLMFSTPIPPKQILLFTLFKQAYMSIIMDFSFFIAAIFIFNIPIVNAFLFFIVNFIFSNLMQYSLALIMYGSENLTEKHKQTIKWFVYSVMLIVTLWSAIHLYTNEFSVSTITNLVNQPFILMIPIFGWELAWLHTIILEPTLYSIVGSILFIITSITLTWYAYRMKCTGDYYEDALNFANRQAKIIDKQGDVSFKEMIGKDRKVFKSKVVLKGTGARVIFSRQLMERTRTHKMFFSFGDLFMLAIGIGGGILGRMDGFESTYFYTAVCAVFLYFLIFFTPSHSWRNDFDQYYIYVMPETMLNKLFYSTLFENFLSLMRSVFLTVPFGLIVGASLIDIVLAIITQILLKVMVSYISIFFSIYIGSKIGKQFGQILTMLVTIIALFIPIILLISSVVTSTLLISLSISVYSIVIGAAALFLCTKVISNIESLKS